MTGKAPFLATLAATLLLAVLHRALSWSCARWEPLSRFIKGRPVQLVENGQIDSAALKRAGLGADDLDEAVRMGNAVANVADVKLAVMEGGGRISITPAKS